MRSSPRRTARQNRDEFYFSENPCIRGHTSKRITSSGQCIECRDIRFKAWAANNKEHLAEQKRIYRQENPDQHSQYDFNKRRKQKSDPTKWFGFTLSSMVRAAFKRNGAAKQQTRTSELLGCSIIEFRKYIEDQWLPGMAWDNWGRDRGNWQLDHKKPIASFDLCDQGQQKQCFKFSNYQPLWQLDNNRKSSFWEGKKY